ncbi:S1C family serine protease [Demequina soli]|uniref:S1C family serine protease n=1 Tax=Demequina soli TaxID=1638987 RepID=UPI000781C9E7|nr:trypsin-like peptidase domain-containing protein [Demequina soli]
MSDDIQQSGDAALTPPPAEPPAGLVIEHVPATRHRRRTHMRRAAMVTAASALALGGFAAGVAVTSASPSTSTATAQTPVQNASNPATGGTSGSTGSSGTSGSSGSSGTSGGYGIYGTLPGGGAFPGDGSGTTQGGSSASGGTSTQTAASAASTSESTGLVLIDTVLGYDSAQAAGTGMVLTSDGLVLTNNHVVEGSTQIQVTIASTGDTYTAKVVGTDATDDVAVLQLQGASGLTTVTTDKTGVAVGDTVTAVGNASGGGTLMAADGAVTGLDATVTTAAEYTAASESLSGMIQFGADVVAGDSGGALLDSQGEVVGMTTAASTGSADTVAFAIPIDDALSIAQQIESGQSSSTITIGYPAMLGVSIAAGQQYAVLPGGRLGAVTTTDGAQVEYVYPDTPAAQVGLVAGDTITAANGTTVTSQSDLSGVLTALQPGDSVKLTWTDTAGATHTGTATLTEGPAA